jgi:predicted esterase
METVGQLNELIDSEVNAGLDPSRIVLGGFSQGAAMSLLTGLTCKHRLGGLVVLSGWLPLSKTFQSVSSRNYFNLHTYLKLIALLLDCLTARQKHPNFLGSRHYGPSG